MGNQTGAERAQPLLGQNLAAPTGNGILGGLDLCCEHTPHTLPGEGACVDALSPGVQVVASRSGAARDAWVASPLARVSSGGALAQGLEAIEFDLTVVQGDVHSGAAAGNVVHAPGQRRDGVPAQAHHAEPLQICVANMWPVWCPGRSVRPCPCQRMGKQERVQRWLLQMVIVLVSASRSGRACPWAHRCSPLGHDLIQDLIEARHVDLMRFMPTPTS